MFPIRDCEAARRFGPRLSALGSWPVRQMFAWAQPKIVARAMIPILVMMPLGTTADAAMVVIALFGVVGALLLIVVGGHFGEPPGPALVGAPAGAAAAR